MTILEHIRGHTFHGRRGGIENAFRYSVDYVLIDPEANPKRLPRLFSRNGRNLTAFYDVDHGGPTGAGTGVAWVRDVLSAHHIADRVTQILLMAQPRVLGHVFNPVSFWLCYSADRDLIAVIAEVTNTFKERHSYLCHHADLRPIAATDTLTAQKIFYVSPFQPVEGGYEFRFDIRDDKIGIWIDYSTGNNGLIATLTGKRALLTDRSILSFALRRPFGSRRVLALIHWQALKLWWKGAKYRVRPTPPSNEISG
jgi:DUF1365 family protein